MAGGFQFNGVFNVSPNTSSISATRAAVLQALNGMTVTITLNTSNAVAQANQFNSQLNQVRNTAQGLNQQLQSTQSTLAQLNAIAGNTGGLRGINDNLKNISRSAGQAETAMESFGLQLGFAARRYFAFSLAASSISDFFGAIKRGIGEALQFERQLVRLAQVGGGTSDEIAGIRAEVDKLSTGLGVSSKELIANAVTLRQAGLSIKETQAALKAVSEASLSPSFGNINSITETLIAARQQFKLTAEDYGATLSSINAISKAYAVEAKDLEVAIKGSGGAFAAAGGNLNEFLGLITAVRQTTRESAEAISTGLRTISARLQRTDTVEALKEFGIELRRTRQEAQQLGNLDLQGQFVGVYEAIARIREGTRQLPTTDPRFAEIVELIGGYRQISRTIPLIQQFSVAQQAVATGIIGTNSASQDAVQIQETLIQKTAKLGQEFLKLLRSITSTSTFQTFANSLLFLANAFVDVTEKLKPLIPLITAFVGFKLGASILGLFGPSSGAAFAQGLQGVRPGIQNQRGFASGGPIPGNPAMGDVVPARLQAGEFVIKEPSARKIGYDVLNQWNHMADGGKLRASYHSKSKQNRYLDAFLTPKVTERIPEGSEFLGEGLYSIAFKTPDGQVIRLQPGGGKVGTFSNTSRPNISGLLQSYENEDIEGVNFQRLPLVTPLTQVKNTEFGPFRVGQAERTTVDQKYRIVDLLKRRLARQGYSGQDLHLGNIGIRGLHAEILDPGSVRKLAEGGPIRLARGSPRRQLTPEELAYRDALHKLKNKDLSGETQAAASQALKEMGLTKQFTIQSLHRREKSIVSKLQEQASLQAAPELVLDPTTGEYGLPSPFDPPTQDIASLISKPLTSTGTYKGESIPGSRKYELLKSKLGMIGRSAQGRTPLDALEVVNDIDNLQVLGETDTIARAIRSTRPSYTGKFLSEPTPSEIQEILKLGQQGSVPIGISLQMAEKVDKQGRLVNNKLISAARIKEVLTRGYAGGGSVTGRNPVFSELLPLLRKLRRGTDSITYGIDSMYSIDGGVPELVPQRRQQQSFLGKINEGDFGGATKLHNIYDESGDFVMRDFNSELLVALKQKNQRKRMTFKQIDEKFSGSEALFRKSLFLNPTDSTTHAIFADLLEESGKYEESTFYRQLSENPNLLFTNKLSSTNEKFRNQLRGKFASGGSTEDTVPALLTPGEFVFSKEASQKIGYNRLHQANQSGDGRFIQGFNKGGAVGQPHRLAVGIPDRGVRNDPNDPGYQRMLARGRELVEVYGHNAADAARQAAMEITGDPASLPPRTLQKYVRRLGRGQLERTFNENDFSSRMRQRNQSDLEGRMNQYLIDNPNRPPPYQRLSYEAAQRQSILTNEDITQPTDAPPIIYRQPISDDLTSRLNGRRNLDTIYMNSLTFGAVPYVRATRGENIGNNVGQPPGRGARFPNIPPDPPPPDQGPVLFRDPPPPDQGPVLMRNRRLNKGLGAIDSALYAENKQYRETIDSLQPAAKYNVGSVGLQQDLTPKQIATSLKKYDSELALLAQTELRVRLEGQIVGITQLEKQRKQAIADKNSVLLHETDKNLAFLKTQALETNKQLASVGGIRDDRGFFTRAKEGVGNFFRDPSRGLLLASIGAQYAGTLSRELIETPQQAVTKGTERSFKNVSGIAGAIEGGALGALIGGQFGVKSGIAGGIIGLLQGFFSSAKQAEEQIRQVKLDDALKILEQRVTAVNSALERGDNPLQSDVIDARNNLGISLTQLNAQALQESSYGPGFLGARHLLGPLGITATPGDLISGDLLQTRQRQLTGQALSGQLPNFLRTLQLTAGSLARGNLTRTPQQLAEQAINANNGLNRQYFDTIVRTNNVNPQNIRAEIERTIVNQQASERRRQAEASESKALTALGQLVVSIEGVVQRLSDLDRATNVLTGTFGGRIQENRLEFNTGSIQNLLGTPQFARTITGLSGFLPGGARGELESSALLINRLAEELPTILVRTLRTSDTQLLYTSTTEQQVRTSFGLGNGPLPQIIRGVLGRLGDISPEDRRRGIEVGDVTPFVNERLLGPVAKITQEAFVRLAKTIETAGNIFEKRLTEIAQSRLRAEEFIFQATKAGVDARRQALEFDLANRNESSQLFQKISVGQLNQPFLDRQANLVAGLGVNPQDPVSIGAALRRVQSQIIPATEARDRVGVIGGPDAYANLQAAQSRLKDLTTSSARLQQALENLTKASDQNAAAQERINQINKEEESRRNLGRNLLTAGPEQRAEFNQGLLLAIRAYNGGNIAQGGLRNFSSSQNQLIFRSLDQIGGAQFPGLGGTGTEIANKLVGASGLPFRISPAAATERQDLQNKVVENLNKSAEAFRQLAETQQSGTRILLDGLRDLNREFLNEMRQIEIRRQEQITRVGIREDERTLATKGRLIDTAASFNLGLTGPTGPGGTFQLNPDRIRALRNPRIAELLNTYSQTSGNIETELNRVRGNLRTDTLEGAFEDRGLLSTSGRERLVTGILGRLGGGREQDVRTALQGAIDVAGNAGISLSTGAGEAAVSNATNRRFLLNAFISQYAQRLPGLREQLQAERLTPIDTSISGILGRGIGTTEGGRYTPASFDFINRLTAFMREVDIQAPDINAFNQSIINTTASLTNLNATLAGLTAERVRIETGVIASGIADSISSSISGAFGFGGFNSGGPVYANRGLFQPKGTDTVPAMLTPGEYVINAQATKSHFRLLKAINEGKLFADRDPRDEDRTRGSEGSTNLYRGGLIYRAVGGLTPERRLEIMENRGDPVDGPEEMEFWQAFRREERDRQAAQQRDQALEGPFVGLQEILDRGARERFQRQDPRQQFVRQLQQEQQARAAARQRNEILDRGVALEQFRNPSGVIGFANIDDPNQQNKAAQGANFALFQREMLQQNTLGGSLGQEQRGISTSLLRERIEQNQSSSLLKKRVRAIRRDPIEGIIQRGLDAELANRARDRRIRREENDIFNPRNLQRNADIQINQDPALAEQVFRRLGANQREEQENRARIHQEAQERIRRLREQPRPFAIGGYVDGPMGRDVIPAMLSRGEYVMPTSAVANIGVPTLNKVAQFASGGPVGGQGGPSLDFTALATAFSTFDSSSKSLIQALNAFPQSISLEGNQKIEVIINGAEILTQLEPRIRKMAIDAAITKIQEFAKDKLPDLGPVQFNETNEE